MNTRIFTLIFCLLTSNVLFADMIGYSSTLTLKIKSKNFIIVHYHDWTVKTNDTRFKMITTDQNPFTKDNNYAFIECINRKTGKVIFKKPCPALTKIEISNDERYIIGISKIMLWNPYQLVVYSTNGNLIKARHIESEEAKLTLKECTEFKKRFNNQYQYLDSVNSIYNGSNFVYIDFMNMPEKLGKAWDFLLNHSCNNHLSDNFSESVTNWIFWFDEKNPGIHINYKKNNLHSISLLDPKQKRIEIKIKE